MTKQDVLYLVSNICNTATSCRGIANNEVSARKLLELANVSESVEIIEIPLNWDNQVVILFMDNGIEKELFAGIGTDGEFYFQLDGVDVEMVEAVVEVKTLFGTCGVKTLSNFGGIVIKISDCGDCLDYQYYDDAVVEDVEIEYFEDTENVLGYDDDELYSGFKIGETIHFLGEFIRTEIRY